MALAEREGMAVKKERTGISVHQDNCEKCVLCHKSLMISITQPVTSRKYYIEGAGQLCEECFQETYQQFARKL